MNLEKALSRLLALAKARKPSEDVPYAFEKRVMSHILSAGRIEKVSDYISVLWKAAGSCACIMIFTLVVSYAFQSEEGLGNHDLESTVFASMSQHIEDSW
jgi:hypothetical protein